MKSLFSYLAIGLALLFTIPEKAFSAVDVCISTAAPHTISSRTVYVCPGIWLNLIATECSNTIPPDKESYIWRNLESGTQSNAQNFFTKEAGRWEVTVWHKDFPATQRDRDTVWVIYRATPSFDVNNGATGGTVTICRNTTEALWVPTGSGISGFQWWFDQSPSDIVSSTQNFLLDSIPADTTGYLIVQAEYNGGTYTCPLYDTVYAVTFPDPKPYLGVDTVQICQEQSITLTDTLPLAGYGFAWNGSSVFGTVKSYTTGTEGTYTIAVQGPFPYTCIGYDTVYVKVNTKPIVNTSSTTTICYGNNIVLGSTVSAAPGPFKFAWTPKASLNDSTLQSPTASPTSTTNYTVIVTTEKNCKDTATRTIIVNPAISITPTFTDSTICSSDGITLGAIVSGGTGPYNYSWGPNTAITGANTSTPLVNPTASTTYTLSLLDTKNCGGNISINIDLLWVSLGSPDTLAIVGDSVLLNAYNPSHHGFSYEWQDSTGTVIATTPSIWVKLTNEYTVRVINTSTNCFVSATKEVIFTNEIIQEIFVPNVFNPGMIDPNNSNLRVYGNNISDNNFVFQVFNNWGELIYESYSFSEAHGQGWNGKLKNTGQPLSNGVYTYSVRGEFYDGSVFEKTGTASLIR